MPVHTLPDPCAVERGQKVSAVGKSDIGLSPRRRVHLRNGGLGDPVGAVTALGEPHDIESRIIGAFEQCGQPPQVISGEMPLPFETLIVECNPVRGKLRRDQFLQRNLLFAGNRRCRRTDGDIRHTSSLWRLSGTAQDNNRQTYG
jgi:hypothetical protein